MDIVKRRRGSPKREGSFQVNFKIGKRIGAGSFGLLRIGQNQSTKEYVAIKLELNRNQRTTLPTEYKLYRILGQHDGIPRIYYFGPCGKYNALVMELLGPSLQKCFETCNKKLSVKTAIQILLQVLARIEFVHSKGIVYRDIKPENFLLGVPGSDKANTVHIIDFGLGKQYIDRRTKKHIPYAENKHPTGTARYMSLNTHLGREQSRRDDLEAIGHMVIYFLKGSLPWQGLPINKSEDKYKVIYDKKSSVTIEQLCEGLPEEFRIYMKYTRGLDFYETPSYEYLRSLFTKLFDRQNFAHDNEYDWSKSEAVSSTSVTQLTKKSSNVPNSRTNSPSIIKQEGSVAQEAKTAVASNASSKLSGPAESKERSNL